MAPLAHVKARL